MNLNSHRRHRTRHFAINQRGVAIITALLVVVLAAGIATYLLAQQSHALTRTARATGRAQAAQYAGPTLDYARAVLFDAQKNKYVSYQQPWAQQITAMPIENALASGVIRDEAGKFNLNNLVLNGAANQDDVKIFRQLLTNLDLNPDLSDAVVDWIDPDMQPTPAGAEDSYYMNLPAPYRAANQNMVQWQELARVRGFDSKTLQRLAPFVTALPVRTLININTAPQEVLAALLPALAASDIASIVTNRETQPFLSIDPADMQKRPGLQKLSSAALNTIIPAISVSSDYFLILIGISSDASQVAQTALVRRQPQSAAPAGTPGAWPSIIWVQTQ